MRRTISVRLLPGTVPTGRLSNPTFLTGNATTTQTEVYPQVNTGPLTRVPIIMMDGVSGIVCRRPPLSLSNGSLISPCNGLLQLRHCSSSANSPLTREVRLKHVKAAFGEENWNIFTSQIDDWESSLRGQASWEISSTLRLPPLGFSDAYLMSAALTDYFERTAMTLLTESAGAYPATERDWVFSNPTFNDQPPQAVNLTGLRQLFHKGEVRIHEGFQDSDWASRSPLVIAFQGGIGTGKSFVIDIAHELLFVGENPVVLKVAYNDQALTRENNGLNEREHVHRGFLARVVIALYKSASPKSSTQLVNEIVSAPGVLREDTVASRILSHPDVGERPIIIAVDDIGHLGESAQEVVSSIEWLITEINKQSKAKKKLRAIGLVTALPHVSMGVLSGRLPVYTRPIALTHDESIKFLRENTSPMAPDDIIDEMNRCCGGHQKSLAVAAKKFNEQGTCTMDGIASDCNWEPMYKQEEQITASDIRNQIISIYTHDYTTPRKPLPVKGILMLRGAMVRRWGSNCEKFTLALCIPPTVLFAPFASENSGCIERLRKMLRLNMSNPVPTEAGNYHWEYFRCSNAMPVFPSGLEPHVPKGNVLQWRKYDLKFIFDSTLDPITADVLETRRGVALAKIDQTRYYFPSSPNHRAFQSMCVAKSEKEEVLCLFLWKTNDDLSKALVGLNKAAKELKDTKTWKGHFLFVVFALGIKGDPDSVLKKKKNSKHPVLFVNEQGLPDYFTHTLAPAARVFLEHHKGRPKAEVEKSV